MDFSEVSVNKPDTIAKFLARDPSVDRRSEDQDWAICAAFYAGKQYVTWHPTKKSLYIEKAPRRKVQVAFNEIGPAVQDYVASLLELSPEWDALPATGSAEDTTVARASTRVGRHIWRVNTMDSQMVRSLTLNSIMGSCFLRVFWDPFRGARQAAGLKSFSGNAYSGKEEDGEEYLESANETYRKKKGRDLVSPESIKSGKIPFHFGDVGIEVIPSPMVYQDPDSLTFEDARYIRIIRQRDPSFLMQRYGLSRDEIMKAIGERNEWRRNMRNLAPTTSPYDTSEIDCPEWVDVDEVYAKPTLECPDGWWAVCVGGKVVRAEKNKKGMPTFPIVMLQDIWQPERFWPSSMVSQMVGPQRAYNRAMCQPIEWLNFALDPPWLNPLQSGLEARDFYERRVLDYSHPYMPSIAQIPPFPSTHQQTVNTLKSALNALGRRSPASRGEAPGRVDNASGIQTLVEQTKLSQALSAIQISEAMGKLGSMAVMVAAKMYRDERIINVVGRDNQAESHAIRGEDLVGKSRGPDANYFDVKWSLKSALPRSREGRQKLGEVAVSIGLLDPKKPRHAELLADLFDVGTDVMENISSNDDRSNARRENGEFLEFNAPPVYREDNHAVHIEEHENFSKTTEFRERVEGEGGIDVSKTYIAYEAHMEIHNEYLQAIVASQSGGVPPGPGPEAPAPPGPTETVPAPV